MRASALILLVGLTQGAAVAPAEPPTVAPVEGERVLVELRLHSTRPGEATDLSGSASAPLAAGEPVSLHAVVDSGLCTLATGTDGPPLDRPGTAWRTRATLLAASLEEIEMDLEWQRLAVDTRGQTRVSAGDTRRIKLREQGRHALDFVDGSLAPGACAWNAGIEVSTALVEDPELASRRLDYEMWLVDRVSGVPPVWHRVTRGTNQGGTVEFVFPPLRWPLADLSPTAEVTVDVGGSVRGRVRRDGSVELSLVAERRTGLATSGSTRGHVSDGGEKRVRLQPGELVELVLPPVGGRAVLGPGQRLSLRGAPEANADATALQRDADGRLVVDLGAFFGAHRMSLVLTATPRP